MALLGLYTRQLYPLPCEYGRPQESSCDLVQDVAPGGAGVRTYTQGSALWSIFPNPRPEEAGSGITKQS